MGRDQQVWASAGQQQVWVPGAGGYWNPEQVSYARVGEGWDRHQSITDLRMLRPISVLWACVCPPAVPCAASVPLNTHEAVPSAASNSTILRHITGHIPQNAL